MLRVLSLVFLFIIRLRFPSNKSIANIFRKRYNNNIVKELRKFEKLDYKIRKNETDLEFLNSCIENDVTPKFLSFKLPNNNLRNSITYKECQLQLLNQEIKDKKTIISRQKKEFDKIKKGIKVEISYLDFAHVCCLFLVQNDKKLTKVKDVHMKKLINLGVHDTKRNKLHNPEDVIFNFSSYKLSDSEKSLLAKGLNFAIPPKKLNYADYLAPFELLYRNVKTLDIDSNILERVKVDLKKASFTSLDTYDFSSELNLSIDEMKTLKDISSRDDLVIQKSDKGNSVVILNKCDYNLRMKELLSEKEKFVELDIRPGKELNVLLQQEDRLVNFLKNI